MEGWLKVLCKIRENDTKLLWLLNYMRLFHLHAPAPFGALDDSC